MLSDDDAQMHDDRRRDDKWMSNGGRLSIWSSSQTYIAITTINITPPPHP